MTILDEIAGFAKIRVENAKKEAFLRNLKTAGSFDGKRQLSF